MFAHAGSKYSPGLFLLEISYGFIALESAALARRNFFEISSASAAFEEGFGCYGGAGKNSLLTCGR
jgi:hypothetical protein